MLTLADRVAYQRAIEEVYWRHRIWPKERPDPKPSLDEVMPPAQLEKKVQDYLRNSEALEDYWQKPISAEQLQAEMERMAQHTKQPEVLRELFEALGNEPFVIAECLARPVLAERLLKELNDEDGVKPTTVAWLKELSQFRVAGTETQAPMEVAAIDSIAKAVQVNRPYHLPATSSPSGICIDDTWTSTSTTNAPSPRDLHTAVWTGSEMIVWGGYNPPSNDFNTGGRYDPTTDSWTATSTTNAPQARHAHTAVWTGSEMIVWGGLPGYLSTGGRYNPATDTWVATNTTNAPTGRFAHTAVWTGSEMIVWGGYTNGNPTNTGGRYDPSTDSWTATSTNNTADREYHTAVWTGSEMIVWAGYSHNIGDTNTGGRYNPSADNWTATSTTNAPAARERHTAVWTDTEMIVWGGQGFGPYYNTGGRYNPSTDTWTATTTINAPVGRIAHAAVWTDSKMIVWGGVAGVGNYLNTGGRYDPPTDSWTGTSTISAPASRSGHTAVWTGSQMVVWGGFDGTNVLNTGGRYCAQSAPMAQSAFSRKTHGAAGTFDVPLPLTGSVGIECRSGGATNDYQMIINFATTVTVGSASVTSGTGSVSSFSVSGSQVTVNLTGVTNVQRITMTLHNVNDGTHMGDVPVSMGVLIGDVNGNAAVNATDVALTKSQVGMLVGSGNFREDVNANGVINSVDVALVKAKVGTALP